MARTAEQAIEYAWHGAESIFDRMLVTGVFLVLVGIMQFSVVMLKSIHFESVNDMCNKQ